MKPLKSTPFLAPGSDNQFTRKNKSIRREAFAHEDGHRDQFSESILKSTDFNVSFETNQGDKTYKGGIQSILDDIYADYETNLTNALEEIKDDNPFNLSEDYIKSEQLGLLNSHLNNAINLITKQIDKKVDAMNTDPGHSDANNRSYEYLDGKSKSKYNSGRKSIIYWGKD